MTKKKQERQRNAPKLSCNVNALRIILGNMYLFHYSSHSVASAANLIGSISHQRDTSHTAARQTIIFLKCSHASHVQENGIVYHIFLLDFVGLLCCLDKRMQMMEASCFVGV